MTTAAKDPHAVAMRTSANGAVLLADALCEQNGWNRVDVMSGILWGVVELCRKIGMSRERILDHVAHCIDCHIVDEHPQKGAPS